MLKIVGVLLILIVGAGVGAAYKYGFILNPSPTAPPPESSVYDFTMRDIDGGQQLLEPGTRNRGGDQGVLLYEIQGHISDVRKDLGQG